MTSGFHAAFFVSLIILAIPLLLSAILFVAFHQDFSKIQ